MDISTKKRVAVVTGANRGIGLELVRKLSRQGMKVVLTSRDSEKAQEAAAKLRSQGHDVEASPLDVTDDKSVRRFASWLSKAHGHVDVLVNNAGAFTKEGATEIDEKGLRDQFDTNFFAPFKVTRAVLPMMGKGGHVVMISSAVASMKRLNDTFETMGTPVGYLASKAAVNVLTRNLAFELRDQGIRVNAVHPGWCSSEMGGDRAPRTPRQGAEAIAQVIRSETLGTGQFLEVADGNVTAVEW